MITVIIVVSINILVTIMFIITYVVSMFFFLILSSSGYSYDIIFNLDVCWCSCFYCYQCFCCL